MSPSERSGKKRANPNEFLKIALNSQLSPTTLAHRNAQKAAAAQKASQKAAAAKQAAIFRSFNERMIASRASAQPKKANLPSTILEEEE